MKMPIINFDEHFAEFMSDWMKAHEDQYANFDEMEEDMPRIYMAFLNTRAKWLGNVTPGAYFTQFEDPKVLVDWLAQYCEEGTPVPDLLMEQITTVGRPCEKRLLELLKDEEATEETSTEETSTEGETATLDDNATNPEEESDTGFPADTSIETVEKAVNDFIELIPTIDLNDEEAEAFANAGGKNKAKAVADRRAELKKQNSGNVIESGRRRSNPWANRR